MDWMKEFEKRRELQMDIWLSIPRSLGFWVGFFVTIYFWRQNGGDLDFSATIGLGVGVMIWLVTHLLLYKIGPSIVDTNLWAWECGCFAILLCTDLFQYLGILGILVFAIVMEDLQILSGAFVAWGVIATWFIISILKP